MIDSKNHNNGFMLIETLFAIVILAMMMTPLFNLQNSTMRAISRFSQKLTLVFDMKKKLYDSKIKLSNKTIKLKTKSISEKSSLKKIKNISIKEIKGSTKNNYNDSIIFVQYNPKKEKGSTP